MPLYWLRSRLSWLVSVAAGWRESVGTVVSGKCGGEVRQSFVCVAANASLEKETLRWGRGGEKEMWKVMFIVMI